MSDRVVNPDALGRRRRRRDGGEGERQQLRWRPTKAGRQHDARSAHPRPRPPTQFGGATWVRNASLLVLPADELSAWNELDIVRCCCCWAEGGPARSEGERPRASWRGGTRRERLLLSFWVGRMGRSVGRRQRVLLVVCCSSWRGGEGRRGAEAAREGCRRRELTADSEATDEDDLTAFRRPLAPPSSLPDPQTRQSRQPTETGQSTGTDCPPPSTCRCRRRRLCCSPAVSLSLVSVAASPSSSSRPAPSRPPVRRPWSRPPSPSPGPASCPLPSRPMRSFSSDALLALPAFKDTLASLSAADLPALPALPADLYDEARTHTSWYGFPSDGFLVGSSRPGSASGSSSASKGEGSSSSSTGAPLDLPRGNKTRSEFERFEVGARPLRCAASRFDDEC